MEQPADGLPRVDFRALPCAPCSDLCAVQCIARCAGRRGAGRQLQGSQKCLTRQPTQGQGLRQGAQRGPQCGQGQGEQLGATQGQQGRAKGGPASSWQGRRQQHRPKDGGPGCRRRSPWQRRRGRQGVWRQGRLPQGWPEDLMLAGLLPYVLHVSTTPELWSDIKSVPRQAGQAG